MPGSTSILSASGLAVAVCLVFSPFAVAADDAAQLRRDFDHLVEMVPGTYDNAPQVAAQVNMGMPEQQRHERVTMVWARVPRPRDCCPGNFAGPDAAFFYVQTYVNGQLVLNNERFVGVYVDAAENAIRWQNMKIKNPAKYVGLHLDSALHAAAELMAPRSDIDCKTLWRRTGSDSFLGTKKGGACEIRSEYSGKQRTIENTFELTEDYFSYMDRGLEDGRVVYGRKDAVGHKMFRVYGP